MSPDRSNLPLHAWSLFLANLSWMAAPDLSTSMPPSDTPY